MGRVYGIVVDGRVVQDQWVSPRGLGRALRRIDADGLYRCSQCGQLHVGARSCGPCSTIKPPPRVQVSPTLVVGACFAPPEQVRVPPGLVAAVALNAEVGGLPRALTEDEARLFLAGYGEASDRP